MCIPSGGVRGCVYIKTCICGYDTFGVTGQQPLPSATVRMRTIRGLRCANRGFTLCAINRRITNSDHVLGSRISACAHRCKHRSPSDSKTANESPYTWPAWRKQAHKELRTKFQCTRVPVYEHSSSGTSQTEQRKVSPHSAITNKPSRDRRSLPQCHIKMRSMPTSRKTFCRRRKPAAKLFQGAKVTGSLRFFWENPPVKMLTSSSGSNLVRFS